MPKKEQLIRIIHIQLCLLVMAMGLATHYFLFGADEYTQTPQDLLAKEPKNQRKDTTQDTMATDDKNVALQDSLLDNSANKTQETSPTNVVTEAIPSEDHVEAASEPIAGGFWFSLSDAPETTDLLLANGANPNARNEVGETPLMIAAAAGDDESVKVLLKYGAQVNAQAGDDPMFPDVKGNTPLHFAVYFGYPRTMEILLKNGADPLIVNEQGALPFHLASYITDDGIRRQALYLLFRFGSDYNVQNYEGNTLLHLLADQNSSEGVSYVMQEKGNFINLTLKNHDGYTPLDEALVLNREAITPLLENFNNTQLGLDLTKSVNERDAQGYAGIHLAALQGNMDYAQKLIARGADLGLKSTVGGATALQWALHFDHSDVANLLLDNKAPCTSTNDDGQTLLMSALGIRDSNKRIALMARLIACGADIQARDSRGMNLIDLVRQRGEGGFIEKVLALENIQKK